MILFWRGWKLTWPTMQHNFMKMSQRTLLRTISISSRLFFSLFGGSLLEPCWAQKSKKKHYFSDSKSPPKLNTLVHSFQHRLLLDFGSILESFFIVFRVGFGGRRHGQNIHATPFIFDIFSWFSEFVATREPWKSIGYMGRFWTWTLYIH